ncbi:hypothetical protein [Oceanicaulis sp.]|uniref:hypothetical protein n=1 Tax=Oceanicaulis sp. TaxID=1924941 RepID=UPI003F6F57C0
MGFNIGWIGVRSPERSDILDLLGVQDTYVHDEVNETPMSWAHLPTGWTILFFNTPDERFEQAYTALAQTSDVIACVALETTMDCHVLRACRGKALWSLLYQAEQKHLGVQVGGTPPSCFQLIQQSLGEAQAVSDANGDDVDHLFEIPLQVAEQETGYAYGRSRFDWGEPRFTELR